MAERSLPPDTARAMQDYVRRARQSVPAAGVGAAARAAEMETLLAQIVDHSIATGTLHTTDWASKPFPRYGQPLAKPPGHHLLILHISVQPVAMPFLPM